MGLSKWIKDRAIHGRPAFSWEDVRKAGLYTSEQVLKNELLRLCNNKTIANVYRGFYVIYPVQYVLRGSIPTTYYIDQLMTYLNREYYVCLLSAAEILGAAHQRPQSFSVITNTPKSRNISSRNVTTMWLYRKTLPEECIFTKNTETGTIRVSNALLTAADLIQYQQHVGGLSRACTVIEELASQFKLEQDFSLLLPYVKVAVWQRMGYILDNILEETEIADKLYGLLATHLGRVNYVSLSTTSDRTLSECEQNKRWKIKINVQIETDEI